MPAENPTVPIPRYAPTHTEQVQFDGGVNALSAPHTLKANEVAASTNVDHTLEWGGGAARRGSQLFGTVSGLSNIQITAVARLYGSGDASPWFAVGSGAAGMVALNGSLVSGTVTLTELGTLTASGSQAFIITSNTQAYLAYGVDGIRGDGTNNYSWILPAPGFPPIVTTNTVFQSNTGFNGTLTASFGGSVVSAAGSPFILTTASMTGSSTTLVLQAATVTTNWEFPTAYTHTADFTGLGGTSTYSVGVYGVDYALVATDHPELITSVSIDLSIGDATFTNYWHKNITPGDILNAAPDPYALLLDAQLNSEVTNLPQTIVGVQRALLPRPRGGGWDPAKYKPAFLPAPTATFAIPIPRTDWQLVGTLPGPSFTSINAVKYTFTASSPIDSVVAGPLLTYGNQICCLSDLSNGIIYFYTFAQVVNGLIVAESAPSPPSYQSVSGHFSRHGFVGGTTGPLYCQNAAAQVALHGVGLSTNTSITHAVLYRQGGLLQDAYQVGSASIATTTITMTDIGAPDLLILENPVLSRNVFAPPGGPSGNFLGTGFTAVSEPWQERVFVAQGNQLSWSAPGQPTKFQSDSTVTVSNQGDFIQGFSAWDRLLIINQNSVYEMYGTIFEGGNQNWTLNRTGARRGSAAPRTAIKTPYGVLLFGFDGVSVYYPGYGVDTQLGWVNDRIGDLWRGTAATDPAGLKGNRIPALNASAISSACAAYGDNRIYLAVPTGTNTLCDTVFVLDMARQIVSGVFQYPFQISSLYWDYINNRLVAGVLGGLQHLEVGLSDSGVGVNWNFTTKDWTTPTDVILENLEVEAKGQGVSLSAQVDNNAAQPLGTGTSAAKDWTPLTFGGTIGKRVNFTASGTQLTSQQEVTQLQWDFIPQTPKVRGFTTDIIPVPSENYIKTGLALLDMLGTATVTVSYLIDGVPGTLVGGGTSTALTAFNFMNGKRWYTVSMPNITVGKTIQAIYSSTTPFKYYQTEFEFEPKPFDKTTWLVTYKKAGGVTQADMARFYAMDIEGPINSTFTSTWIIDGTAFSTNTLMFGSTQDVGEEINVVRNYMDLIPFPPGGRGYLFQQQITSALPFKVWRASLDIERIGIKGLSRVTMNGTPQEGSKEARG